MRSLSFVVLVVVAATLSGLTIARAERATRNMTGTCVSQFDRTADYFPDKAAIQDAVNFRVEYRRSYKVVTVKEANGGHSGRYVLVQCGTPPPKGEQATEIVTVPITSMFAASTTQLSPLVELDRLDVLTGVARLKDLTGDALARLVSTGRVQEFAPASVIDTELVAAHRPSMLMTSGGPNAGLSVIRDARVPVVVNGEWLEESALARAEWMKYIALFLNEERKAEILYDRVRARYRALSARAMAAPRHPLVMAGRSTNGRFVIAGGRSYVASLVRDAGGRYVWSDNTSTGTSSVDLEAQIQRAARADVWINGGGWASRSQMLQDEPRYAAFKAYRDDQVWVYERRLQPSGANEYWTRSVTRPDLVLADLVKIFHPELMNDYSFEWYMRVPQK